MEVIRNSATRTCRRSSSSPAHLRGERARVEREIRGRCGTLCLRSAHVQRPAGRDGRVIVASQTTAAKVRREQRSDRARRLRGTGAHRASQLTKPRVQFLRLALRRERVAARFEVLQKRLDDLGRGELGAIDFRVLRARVACSRKGVTTRMLTVTSAVRGIRCEAGRVIVRHQRGRLGFTFDTAADSDNSSTCRRSAASPLPSPAAAAGHADLHGHRTGVRTQADVCPQIALREIAPA